MHPIPLLSVLGDREVTLVPRPGGASDDLIEALGHEFGRTPTLVEPGAPGWLVLLNSIPIAGAVVLDAREQPLRAVAVMGELWRSEVRTVAVVEAAVTFPRATSAEAEYILAAVGGREYGAIVRLPRSQWQANPSFTLDRRRPMLRQGPDAIGLDPAADVAGAFRRDADREPRLITAADTARTTARLRSGLVTADSAPDPREVARLVVRACSWGLPVRATTGPWRQYVHSDVLDQVDRTSTIELADPAQRERHSVRLRRAALTTHAGLPAASVTVIVATKRPDLVLHAASQVTDQSYRPLELVFAAHGEEVVDRVRTHDIAGRCREVGVGFVRVEALASERFGVLLNRATDAASGSIVTKMDDDDWYGREHVGDVVVALQWSGARLAGKAAEFVYLADLNRTVRRQAAGSESWSTLVSGATLTIRRHDLLELGGWAPTNRAVDRRLIDAAVRSGEFPFRTHGFGLLVHRHGEGQTWDVGSAYFLRRTSGQWRGIAREEAMIHET